MMSEKFEIGDVVQLKSGGELMTVEGYTEVGVSKRVLCVWSEKSKVYRDAFLEQTIDKYEPMSGFSIG